MRILMVSEDLPGERVGGLGKHVVTLANAMLEQGHHVAILGRNDRGRARCAEQIGFRGRFIPGFDYARPGWKEQQMGVFNPFKRPYFARKVARAIDEHADGFHVVHYHGHLPMVGLYVDRAVRYVQTRHDQGSECLTHLRFRGGAVCDTVIPRDCSACISASAGPLRKGVTALAVNSYRSQSARTFATHKTIFVSDFLRRQFMRAVPDADLSATRVIHNFIDYARLRACARDAGAVEPGHIVMVGRIDLGKGFGEFLELVAPRLAPSCRVSIVGDGPQRAALEARFGGDQVRFLGWRHYDEALALSARAHLCVVPSVCEEACSTTVLEALALGRQCVALARGGTPELAAYQLRQGQLALADDMPALVERALALLDQAPASDPLAPQFGADAALVLPQILEFYAD